MGDQITVPFEGKEYPFTVSAILSSPDTGVEAYSVMVSQSFLKEQPGYDPGKYNAYVHFKEADSYKADDLKDLGAEIRDRLGLRSVSYSSIYFSIGRTIQPEEILQLGAVVLAVVLGGSMVIRNIFRISILEKIQSYGQLRTLGATKRQIQRLVRRESRFLALIGIPIGILAGIVTGTLLASNLFASGFSMETDLTVALVTALVSYGMVSISVRKPVQLPAVPNNIKPRRQHFSDRGSAPDGLPENRREVQKAPSVYSAGNGGPEPGTRPETSHQCAGVPDLRRAAPGGVGFGVWLLLPGAGRKRKISLWAFPALSG